MELFHVGNSEYLIKDPTLFDGLGPCFGLVQITGSILLRYVLKLGSVTLKINNQQRPLLLVDLIHGRDFVAPESGCVPARSPVQWAAECTSSSDPPAVNPAGAADFECPDVRRVYRGLLPAVLKKKCSTRWGRFEARITICSSGGADRDPRLLGLLSLTAVDPVFFCCCSRLLLLLNTTFFLPIFRSTRQGAGDGVSMQPQYGVPMVPGLFQPPYSPSVQPSMPVAVSLPGGGFMTAPAVFSAQPASMYPAISPAPVSVYQGLCAWCLVA